MKDKWTLSAAGRKHGVGVGMVDRLRWAQIVGARLRTAL